MVEFESESDRASFTCLQQADEICGYRNRCPIKPDASGEKSLRKLYDESEHLHLLDEWSSRKHSTSTGRLDDKERSERQEQLKAAAEYGLVDLVDFLLEQTEATITFDVIEAAHKSECVKVFESFKKNSWRGNENPELRSYLLALQNKSDILTCWHRENAAPKMRVAAENSVEELAGCCREKAKGLLGLWHRFFLTNAEAVENAVASGECTFDMVKIMSRLAEAGIKITYVEKGKELNPVSLPKQTAVEETKDPEQLRLDLDFVQVEKPRGEVMVQSDRNTMVIVYRQ